MSVKFQNLAKRIDPLLQENDEVAATPQPDADRPSRVEADGTWIWENAAGQLHRPGGKPAVLKADGSEEHWENGHRIGEPLAPPAPVSVGRIMQAQDEVDIPSPPSARARETAGRNRLMGPGPDEAAPAPSVDPSNQDDPIGALLKRHRLPLQAVRIRKDPVGDPSPGHVPWQALRRVYEQDSGDLAPICGHLVRSAASKNDGVHVTTVEGATVVDRGSEIESDNGSEATVRLMVEQAKAKSWSSFRAEGSPEFMSNLWLECQRQGIELRGFEPSAALIQRWVRERNGSRLRELTENLRQLNESQTSVMKLGVAKADEAAETLAAILDELTCMATTEPLERLQLAVREGMEALEAADQLKVVDDYVDLTRNRGSAPPVERPPVKRPASFDPRARPGLRLM